MERALNLIKEILSNTFISLLKKDVSIMYLVGGALRDAYYGIPLKDFDFVVSNEDLEVVTDFLEDRKIHYFNLNKGQFLLLRATSNNFTFDFMRLDDSIENDENKRDFTINALYYDIKADKSIFKDKFIDDLEMHILRVVDDNSIKSDPIRSLRGIRLAADLALSIEPGTKQFIREGVSLLQYVPKDRVREEVKKILHTDFNALSSVFFALFGIDLADLLPRVNAIDRMELLGKEINKDVSFKDLCKLSILVKHFDFLLAGFTGKERRYIEQINSLNIENNFDSLFESFANYLREIRIPLCAVACFFNVEDALKAYDLFLRWGKIKINGNELKKNSLGSREIGDKKKELLKAYCRKIYEEI